MDNLNIADFLNSVAFPIAMCVFLIIDRKNCEKQHTEQIKELTKSHETEVNNLRETIVNTNDITNNVIENNTKAITILNERLRGRKNEDDWNKCANH